MISAKEMVESIRERLERLKNTPPRSFEPLQRDPRVEEAKRMISPESVFMKKVEKVMIQYGDVKKKMLSDSGQYLSLYYELKKAEEAFLALVNDPEVKFLDLPDVFMQKVEAMRLNILAKKK